MYSSRTIRLWAIGFETARSCNYLVHRGSNHHRKGVLEKTKGREPKQNIGARYYEPTSGRFLSADPFGQAASPSLYDFAGGDPVNSFDPTGRCPDKNSNQGNTSGQQLADQIANFQFVDPVNGGQNPADPQVAQQNVYITDSGSTVPLTPGSLTWDQIQNLQMDSLDAATILRLLGLDYQKFGLENIQINAARLALYANQGQSQLAQVRAIGFMAYAVNLLVSVFQPRAETPIETGAWSAGFAQDAAGVTVIGSMRDVAPYLTKSEFNTLLIPNFQYLDPAVVDSINANFMRVAIQRGDDFWLVTDPVAHTINSQQFNFESRYLNIEIPMLNTGRGVVIPTAPTR
jgi:RHS repeat-associated protein